MTTKNSKIKVGVLNMTICFDKPYNASPLTKQFQRSPQKGQQIPLFIPKFGSQRQKHLIMKTDMKMNPYQRYRYTKNQSIRYFRQQQQSQKYNFQKIAGLSPSNNKIQLEFTEQDEPQEETIYTRNNFIHDNHLKMVFNKKHLRNTIDLHQEQIKTHQRLIFNLRNNPQDNLRNVFTVRPAKTSQRARKSLKQIYESMSKQDKIKTRPPISQRQPQQMQKQKQEGLVKLIRPWSTSKNWQSTQ